MKRRTGFLTGGLTAAILALGLAGPAPAADSGSAPSDGGNSTQQRQQDQPRISDQKLQQFVAAARDIRSVRSEYIPKMRQAQGKEEKTQLRKQGQQEMIKAIRANGMDVSEYQRVAGRLNTDQELRQRLKKILGQKQPQGTQQQPSQQ